MDFYQANHNGNQYSNNNNGSHVPPRIIILKPPLPSSSSSSSVINNTTTTSSSRKRTHVKSEIQQQPKTIIVPKRRKDVLSSISPSSSRCNNGDQTVKNLLDFFSYQQPSSTLSKPRETTSPFSGRGRPLINSKNVNVTENMVILPPEQCAYKKHKTEDRIQRLFVFSDFAADKGSEYGFYTKSKEPGGATLHGFYCMECSNIRKKREFDALIRVDKSGEETFMAKPHINGCLATRDNGGRYSVNAVSKPVPKPVVVAATTSNSNQNILPNVATSSSTTSSSATTTTITMNETTLQNMVRTAVLESSQQLIATMIEQIRTVVREEVALQLQAVNNNFGANYIS